MQIVFRTTVPSGRIVRIVLGAFVAPTAGLCVFGLLAVASADTGTSPALLLLVGLAIAAGVAWLVWSSLPPLRSHLLVFAPEALTIRGYGATVSLPWHQLELLRIETAPVRRRLPGNGPYDTWHLVAVPRDQAPVAVPLDTFETTIDAVVTAFQQTAPDSLELELPDGLALDGLASDGLAPDEPPYGDDASGQRGVQR